LPDHVWILPPQTSQLKLPECLYGCCSLVAVYGSPQLGQLKCSVVQRSLAMTRLCDAPSTCSSAVVRHNQRPATRMLEPGEHLISTSLTARHWRPLTLGKLSIPWRIGTGASYCASGVRTLFPTDACCYGSKRCTLTESKRRTKLCPRDSLCCFWLLRSPVRL